MSDLAEWYEGKLPAGCAYLGDTFSYAWYLLTEVGPDGLADEVSDVLLLNPDGTTEPVPSTHAGWQFYLDTLSARWPLDDLPRPVAVVKLEGE